MRTTTLPLALFASLLIVLPAAAQRSKPNWPPPVPKPARGKPPGLYAPVGVIGKPRKTYDSRLEITKKGVYQNLLFDMQFKGRDAIRIKADGTVLRNCEIRNGVNDGVEVYADDVLIENCKIHHFLNGTFKKQKDSHGITGRPNRLIIRNCEIYYVTGDCIQFDPDRKPWTDVLIENCILWTGPLPADAGKFKKGEQPGENAFDSKQRKENPRSRIWIRNSVCYGWAKGGQIANMAALNIKDNVECTITNCLFYDNEICLRVRGPGKRGGAKVTATRCFFYRSDFGIRYEDKIEDCQIFMPAFGRDVKRKEVVANGKGKGSGIKGKNQAPALAWFLARMRPKKRRR